MNLVISTMITSDSTDDCRLLEKEFLGLRQLIKTFLESFMSTIVDVVMWSSLNQNLLYANFICFIFGFYVVNFLLTTNFKHAVLTFLMTTSRSTLLLHVEFWGLLMPSNNRKAAVILWKKKGLKGACRVWTPVIQWIKQRRVSHWILIGQIHFDKVGCS